jgi:uncharacterized membrane protein
MVMLMLTSLAMLVVMLFTTVVSVVISIVFSLPMPGFVLVTAGMTSGAVLEIPDALLPMLLG